jgi:2-polyprenyl-6-methoxyphenol hydroxylase-like FAD-dependent oxidoreductase
MLIAVSSQVPIDPLMGAAMRLGPDRMLCALVGYGRPKPPRSAEEFVARSADLSVPEVHRLLRGSKPLSDVTVFANTQNRWRHYGRLPWFPDGLVSIGDAVCTLNPRYGQGMTVAALSADLLDVKLSQYAKDRGHLNGFAHHFQRHLEEALKVPWQMALMEDRLWASVSSGKAPGLAERLVMKGSERVLQTVFTDVHTYIQFMRVAHLLDAPTAMLTPRILGAIARGGARGGERVTGPRTGV